jgi:hypothetical protein
MVALEAREGRRWSVIHVCISTDDDWLFDIDGPRTLGDLLWDAGLDPDETEIRLVDVGEEDVGRMIRRGLARIVQEMAEEARQAAEWLSVRHGLPSPAFPSRPESSLSRT